MDLTLTTRWFPSHEWDRWRRCQIHAFGFVYLNWRRRKMPVSKRITMCRYNPVLWVYWTVLVILKSIIEDAEEKPQTVSSSNLCSLMFQFPGGSDNYLTISGSSHPFLSSSEVSQAFTPGTHDIRISPWQVFCFTALEPPFFFLWTDVFGLQPRRITSVSTYIGVTELTLHSSHICVKIGKSFRLVSSS